MDLVQLAKVFADLLLPTHANDCKEKSLKNSIDSIIGQSHDLVQPLAERRVAGSTVSTAPTSPAPSNLR